MKKIVDVLNKSKKKPSEILEDQLKKKEIEYNLVKEVCEREMKIDQLLNKTELKELSIIPKKQEKVKKNSTPKEMLEKIEKERRKREEKEKLKILEKLEAQVIKKKKLNHLSTNNSENWTANKEPIHKRLIDCKIRKTYEGFGNKIDSKLLDDSEFRKTIKKEKIHIDCDKEENWIMNSDRDRERIDKRISIRNNSPLNEEHLEKEFLATLSKEKKKFFLLKLSDVYEFLTELRLVRYIETFIEDGIEDIECILEIESGYFEERNIFTEEQRVRILSKIKELKKGPQKLSQKSEANLGTKALLEFGTDPMPQEQLLPINKGRKCCWNCLKVILEENSIEHFFKEKIMSYKSFCSDDCFNKYIDNIYTQCEYDGCKARLEKGSGKCLDGQWFCNEECFGCYLNDNEDLIDLVNYQDEGIEDKSLNSEENFEQGEDIDVLNGNLYENFNSQYDPMEDF